MPLIPKAWRPGQGGVRGELSAFLICIALGLTLVPLIASW